MAASGVRQYTELFSQGIARFRSGDRLGALSFFEKAHALTPSAETASYLGLLNALERGLVKEGLAQCLEAMESDPENPLFLYNIGLVYEKAGRMREAIEMVRKAALFGGGDDCHQWLDDRGIRRSPVFRFLSRSNPLNKYAGLALKRLGLR